MPLLLHLNGPSGVGKTTIARAYAATRDHALLLDIDVLRTQVTGWREDFAGTGDRVRTAALALIGAYLATGHDVVLPQLVVTPSELERFERAATDAGAAYVGVVLTLEPAALLARLHTREVTPLVDTINRLIEVRGGDDLVLRGRAQLLELAAERDLAVVPADDLSVAVAALRASTP